MAQKIIQISMKAARIDHGLTQEAIAQRLGVSKTAYAAWENGYVLPKPMVIKALAYEYKMHESQLRIPTPK